MENWKIVADRLYQAVKSTGCRCQFARNAEGVPLWSGVPLTRQRIHQCAKCKATAMYEAALEVSGDA